MINDYTSKYFTTSINAYGPTESTVNATYTVIRQNESANIGKALINCRAYVLGDKQQRIPIGAIGELYIGGCGVALGYLGHPQLTQEKFISSSFEQDEKLYKTGDRVRYIDDGNLEFIGRIDEQVKIRGYRIELGEVVFNIKKQQKIKDASVIVIDENTEETKLAAFLCSELDIDLATIQPEYIDIIVLR